MSERKETSVRVAAAEAVHAADIASLHAQLFERAWSKDDIRRLLEHPACLAFVAFPSDVSGAVGFLLAQAATDEAEIISIGVGRSWQRQGIGGRLVAKLVQTITGMGGKRIFLDVGERNAAAVALYQRLGFSQIAKRRDYYLHGGGRREDALLMVRNL